MWRRDPTLFSRTPIRRSTDTVLRSSRCFSKTRPTHARHKDDESNLNDGKKPEGMSDLEWMKEMRQRHFRRWRKRIEEDPYGALFGASEDMLRGKGLAGYLARQREMHRKGREWVEKTFPKWMLEDMGLQNTDEFRSKEATKPKKPKNEDGYPRKVRIDGEEEVEKNKRGDVFRDSWFRSGRFEKQLGNEGIESPSDSRRPREQPMNPFRNDDALRKDIVRGIRKDIRTPQVPSRQPDIPTQSHKADHEAAVEPSITTKTDTQSSKEATARETSFIEEFLADKDPIELPTRSGHTTSKDWRQTTLERIAESHFALKPRRKTNVSVVDVTSKNKARQVRHDSPELFSRDNAGIERNLNSESKQDNRPALRDHGNPESRSGKAVLSFHGPPGSRVGMKEIEEFATKVNETGVECVAETTDGTGSTTLSERPLPRINTDDWMAAPSRGSTKAIDGLNEAEIDNFTIKNVNDINLGQAKPDAPAVPRRSTSDVLEQLPKDDLDFLSANDVRASMGRTKGIHKDKAAIRQKLDEEYRKDTPELNSMIEAQVVNNQYVRRRTSEMSQLNKQTKPKEAEPATAVPEQKENANPVSVLETSLDFMSRWLHTGGNVLAQHFWQDPVQLVAGQLSGADEVFSKGVGVGVLKGRRAFALIKDELIDDIPAAKELVNRLSSDEIRASAGAARLYRDLPSALKDSSDAAASKTAAHIRVGKLRQALLDTDKQFKEACVLVDSMKNDTKLSFLLEKRLRFAADVLRKNAKLTRMSVFGLQGRIEVATRSEGLVFRELLHRLLTLQDTQLTLLRLVSRTMQVLGINPDAKEIARKSDESAVDLTDPSVVEALASAAVKDSSAQPNVDPEATNKKLDEEISKQKAAMAGLSDDGYKHPPKPFVRKSFEGPNPLAHSLFRPFGLQLDSLSKDVDAEQEGINQAEKKKKGDRELVKEVRKAYEDVYGAITVDHFQVPPENGRTTPIEEPRNVREAQKPRGQASIQLLKEDGISPYVTRGASPSETGPVSTYKDDFAAVDTASEVAPASVAGANDAPIMVENVQPFEAVSKRASTLSESERLLAEVEVISADRPPLAKLKNEFDTLTSSEADGKELAYDTTTKENVPISYKTLIYNAETDKLSVTTSQVPQPNPAITPIPLHEALTTLSHPAKFVDHLPDAFHVISVKQDVLTVRTASPFSPTAEKHVTTIPRKKDVERSLEAEETDGWKGINPVDGTTTLSPTGFEGVGSDLERELDFQERRRKADEYNQEMNEARKNFEAAKKFETAGKKRKGRVGFGGVVRTAIWASAICYVVGVMAEIAKAPF